MPDVNNRDKIDALKKVIGSLGTHGIMVEDSAFLFKELMAKNFPNLAKDVNLIYLNIWVNPKENLDKPKEIYTKIHHH